jgi:hypothetical protein
MNDLDRYQLQSVPCLSRLDLEELQTNRRMAHHDEVDSPSPDRGGGLAMNPLGIAMFAMFAFGIVCGSIFLAWKSARLRGF